MTASGTPGSSKKELVEAKNFMRKNLEIEFGRYFGLMDAAWIDRATNNWFHDENNHDGRWNVIRERAHSSEEPSTFYERKRVVLSWLSTPPVIAERLVAVVQEKALMR